MSLRVVAHYALNLPRQYSLELRGFSECVHTLMQSRVKDKNCINWPYKEDGLPNEHRLLVEVGIDDALLNVEVLSIKILLRLGRPNILYEKKIGLVGERSGEVYVDYYLHEPPDDIINPIRSYWDERRHRAVRKKLCSAERQ